VHVVTYRRAGLVAALFFFVGLQSVALKASDLVKGSVTATAAIGRRAHVRASTEVLRFDVTSGSAAAIAEVTFHAAARAAATDELVVSVEQTADTAGPGGSSADAVRVEVEGDGPGALRGQLSRIEPVAASRWTGGGVRTGKVSFRLVAETPGIYAVPIRVRIGFES
jgi:hypothetical protein